MAVSWCLVGVSAPALAQEAGGLAAGGLEDARFRWGPLGVTPRIALTNIGVDTNVFNAADEPQRDFTFTLTPGADTFLRMGRAEIRLGSSVDWTYFRRSSNQRSLGWSQEGRLDVRLNRLSPYVDGGYVTTRRRPNLEIDARVRQKLVRFGGGTGLRVGGRTWIDLDVRQETIDFGDRTSGDPRLAEALNRETREGGLALRLELTPLTTFTVRSALSQDRFSASTRRNSNSVTVIPSLDLQPRALVSGRVAVGVRQFDALDAAAPDFTGVVAQTEIAYILREMTRFTVALDRDVDYSAEGALPYSVVSSGALSVSQVIGLDWFVTARARRAWLDYRSFETLAEDGTAIAQLGRQDRVTTYGASLARRIGDDLLVGFDVDRTGRLSGVDGRNYEGYSFGGSIIYGR
jgi:hypothetical protein